MRAWIQLFSALSLFIATLPAYAIATKNPPKNPSKTINSMFNTAPDIEDKFYIQPDSIYMCETRDMEMRKLWL